MDRRTACSPAPIEALLFDFGGTIAYLDYSLLADEFSRPGLVLDANGLERAEYAGRAAVDRALMRASKHDLDQVYADYFRRWMEAAAIPPELVEDYRERFRAIDRQASLWRVVRPGTIEALERFRAAGFKLAIVSNAGGNIERDSRRYGIRDYFDLVIDSTVVGVAKPDPRIFRLALDELKVSPERALFAGDIYSVDILGAKAAGMKAKLVDALGLYTWIDHVKIRGIDEFHSGGRIDG